MGFGTGTGTARAGLCQAPRGPAPVAEGCCSRGLPWRRDSSEPGMRLGPHRRGRGPLGALPRPLWSGGLGAKGAGDTLWWRLLAGAVRSQQSPLGRSAQTPRSGTFPGSSPARSACTARAQPGWEDEAKPGSPGVLQEAKSHFSRLCANQDLCQGVKISAILTSMGFSGIFLGSCLAGNTGCSV